MEPGLEGRISLEELAVRLESNLKNGLSLRRVREEQKNRLPTARASCSSCPLLARQLCSYLCLFVLLKAGVAVCFYILTGFLFTLVMGLLALSLLVEALLLYLYYDVRVTSAFKHIRSKRNKLLVVREGVSYSVGEEEVVRGDVVCLRVGDMVPADLRVIEATNLKINASTWTGVCGGEEKGVQSADDDFKIIYAPCVVVEGEGKGMVVSVETKLAEAVKTADSVLTPDWCRFEHVIRTEVDGMGKVFFGSFLFFFLFSFLAAFVLGFHFFDAISYSFLIAFLNLPETIVVAIANILVVFSGRMLKRGVLLRDVRSLVTMGNASAMVVDKTTAVSSGKMQVRHLFFNDVLFAPSERNLIDRRTEGWNSLSRAIILCNKALFTHAHEKLSLHERECSGSLEDAAFLRMMEQEVGGVIEARRRSQGLKHHCIHPHPRVQTSVNNVRGVGSVVSMRGLPEDILQRCSSILVGDKQERLSGEKVEGVRRVCEKLEAMGESVVAFCDMVLVGEKELSGHGKHHGNKGLGEGGGGQVVVPDGGFRFLGVASLLEGIIDGVVECVHRCKMAGIKVILATGDQPITAKTIALHTRILTNQLSAFSEEIGLLDSSVVNLSSHQLVLQASDIKLMSTPQLIACLQQHNEVVFANMDSPAKLKVVCALKRLGHMVLMVGEGASDAPALKASDVGVALGTNINPVTLSSAEVVVKEKSLVAVVEAIVQGRHLIENLKKTAVYLVASTVPFVLATLLNVFLDTPPLYSFFSLLVLKYGIELLPALSLAYESSEFDDIMTGRLVRNLVNDAVLNKRSLNIALGQTGVLQFLAGLFSFVVVMGQSGFLPPRLLGIRTVWDSHFVDDLEDSYGQQWTFSRRQLLLSEAQTTFFITIATIQISNVVLCKTSFKSMFQKGMHNWYLIFSIFFSSTILVLITILPINTYLELSQLSWTNWLLPLPFGVFLIGWDEARKAWVRKHPKGWLSAESSY